MKKIFALVFLVFSYATSQAQEIEAYKIDNLLARTQSQDTLYIVNFWATWCGPCVRELPEFNELYKMYADKPVKILMVSLDFEDAYPKKLASFLKKKNLLPEVVWLNETNANEFIPKIADEWQGSIPATLITYRKNNYRNFSEGIIHAKQIARVVDRQLAK